MRSRQQLLQLLGGHEQAADFIECLFDVLHFWDDLIDKDQPLSDTEINDRMWKALVDLPGNPFYQRFFSQLRPMIVNAIANWQTATRIERDADSSEQQKQVAFVIRSDYANVLIQCVYLVGGRDAVLAATPYIRKHWTDEDYQAFLSNLERERLARGVAANTGDV